MKNIIKPILVIVICLTKLSTFSQHRFTLTELQSLVLKSDNDFETAVGLKGYFFRSELSSEVQKMFWSDKKNSFGKYEQINSVRSQGASFVVGFGTNSSQYYINIKTKVLTKANGWRYLKSEPYDLGGIVSTYYHYTNGKYHVTLYSYSINTSDPTWYNVQCYLESK